jgi:hypothetical protein
VMNAAWDNVGGIHSGSSGGAGRDRLFHGRGPDAMGAGDILRAVFHPSSMRPHSAGSLTFDNDAIVTVTYPFHPLAGQSVPVVHHYQEHSGAHHLMIYGPNGAKLLIPEWMTLPEAAAIRIVSSPRLSVNRLMELRDLIDRLMLTSSGGKRVPGGPSNDALGTGKFGLVHDPAIGRTATTEAKDGTRVVEDASDRGNVRRKINKRRKERPGGNR